MSDQPRALMSTKKPPLPKILGLSDSIELDIDVASDDWQDGPAMVALIQNCVAAVLATFHLSATPLELSVRLTDDADSAQLNRQYRKQDKPTNVLSFSGFERDELQDAYTLAASDGPPVMLGDIIITHGVTSREAREQGKAFGDHMAHLVVHGILHLMGFDHIEEAEANEMESHEKNILASLGIGDPYEGGN